MKTSLILAILLTARCFASAGVGLDVPFFTQQKNGCGAASVAMVMSYWESTRAGELRTTRSREDIYARLYRPEQKGIRLADMRGYLEEAGFRVFTLRGELADLDRHLGKGRPVITGLKGGRAKPVHFVVVTGTTTEFVWLHDPSRPKPLRLKRIDFDRQWTAGNRWMLLATPARRE